MSSNEATPKATPEKHEHHNESIDEHHHYAKTLPRTRTISESENLASAPALRGTVVEFCRQKGYGFIKPLDGGENIFVHISDIEGDWCPKEGDTVSYKRALMPPKMQKHQAVHVHFVHLKEGVKHEHWDNSSQF